MRALRVLRAAAGVAAAVAASAACGGSAFTAGPADDGGTTDGAPAGDASLDGPPTVDGGSDAPQGFCASLSPQPFFCADFDEGDIKRGWDTQLTSRYCDQRLDKTFVRSPPESFLVQTTHPIGGDGGVEQSLAVESKDLGKMKSVSIGFDVYVESYGSDLSGGSNDLNGTILLALQLGYVSYALVATTPTVAAFDESASPDGGMMVTQPHPLSTGLPLGRWVHVDLALMPGAVVGAASVHVSFDNGTVLDSPLKITQVPTNDGVLTMGIFLYSAPNTWKIHYDNVVVNKTM